MRTPGHCITELHLIGIHKKFMHKSPLFPWWPCLNLYHNILSFATTSALACVFSVQNLIIAPIADARLPLDGTYRKCCDRGPMTGKEIKLVCEYINVFPSIRTLAAELKILPFWRKLDPIDFSRVIWAGSSENVFSYLLNSQKVNYHTAVMVSFNGA